MAVKPTGQTGVQSPVQGKPQPKDKNPYMQNYKEGSHATRTANNPHVFGKQLSQFDSLDQTEGKPKPETANKDPIEPAKGTSSKKPSTTVDSQLAANDSLKEIEKKSGMT